jgi:cell wall-associated NlpC family hydrolase
MKNYSTYIGKQYLPPNGCLNLVIDILRNEYNRPLELNDADRAMEIFRTRLSPTIKPQEGDLILLKGNQWHVGLVVGNGQMIHTSLEGEVGIEHYDGMMWRNRIKGFYKWQ